MGAADFEATVEVSRRRLLSPFVLVAALAVLALTVLHHPNAASVANLVMAAASIGSVRRRRRRATVRATPGAFFVNGVKVLRAEAMQGAYLLGGAMPSAVRVDPRRRMASGWDVFLEKPEDAARLLEVLGYGAGRAAVAFDVQHHLWGLAGTVGYWAAWVAVLGVILAAGVGLVGGTLTPFVSILAVSFAALALVALVFSRLAKLVVGADGVLVRGGWSKQFVSYADIEAASDDGKYVVLRRRAGEPVRVRPLAAHYRELDEARATVRQSIEDARRSYERAAQGMAASDQLARGDRALGPWLEALRTSGAGVSYRDAALQPEQLWTVVADPKALASTRAAAALALQSSADDATSAQLRRVAQGCADPKLRVALEAAAAPEDEAALEEAFAALEAAEAGGRTH